MPRLSVKRPFRGVIVFVAALAWFAQPAGAAQFTQIAAGLNHTCAVKADATAWCWGEGRQGQVGVIGTVRTRVPVYVIGSYQASQISSGQGFWCQRLGDSTASCSGLNTRGQIGDGSAANAPFPRGVLGLTGVTKVTTGAATSCAIHSGLVSCWGDGARGQLGNGQLVEGPTTAPVQVPGLENIVDVSVGETHVCAVRSDGLVFCWGDSSDGKLGNNLVAPITVPGVSAIGLTNVKSVAAGNTHTCALKGDGTVWCWGNGPKGQLGQGQAGGSASGVPVPVPDLKGVRQIAGAAETNCAVRSDGSAVCWGDNTDGQIGDGTKVNATAPKVVAGITDAAQISVGNRHACLVTRTQAPFCWGSNLQGQLGNGTRYGTNAPTPQLVQDIVLQAANYIPSAISGVPAGSRAGGYLIFNAQKVDRAKGRSCPTRATLRMTARGRTTSQRVPISKGKTGCLVNGSYLLPTRSERASKVQFRVTGSGLRSLSRTIKARKVPQSK